MRKFAQFLCLGFLLVSFGCGGSGNDVTMPQGLDESQFKPSEPEDLVAGQGSSQKPGLEKK